jgi:transmembrane sensor
VKKNFTKSYHTWSANDFVLDESFCNWVAGRDERAGQFWDQWLKEHPEKKSEIDQARSIIKSLSFNRYAMTSPEVADLWDRIRNFDKDASSTRSAGIRFLWLKVAAAILICAAVIYSVTRPQEPEWISYNTAFGETKSIVLPDGSTVTLNSNSILKFPGDWDHRTIREVWIEGEAFFSVIHKKSNQAFKVYTDDGVAVEVLGTTFNVFHRVKETKVVLNSGRISLSLSDNDGKIIMKPGDMIEYKEKSYSKRTVNPSAYSSWTEKKVVLDHTSLRDMIDMLQNNYGVHVNVSSDELLNQTVSGSMPIGEASDMVKQVAVAFQLKVKKEEHSYMLYEE